MTVIFEGLYWWTYGFPGWQIEEIASSTNIAISFEEVSKAKSTAVAAETSQQQLTQEGLEDQKCTIVSYEMDTYQSVSLDPFAGTFLHVRSLPGHIKDTHWSHYHSEQHHWDHKTIIKASAGPWWSFLVLQVFWADWMKYDSHSGGRVITGKVWKFMSEKYLCTGLYTREKERKWTWESGFPRHSKTIRTQWRFPLCGRDREWEMETARQKQMEAVGGRKKERKIEEKTYSTGIRSIHYILFYHVAAKFSLEII